MAYNRFNVLPRFIVLEYKDGTKEHIEMFGTREKARKKARQRAKYSKCNAYVFYGETETVQIDYIVTGDGSEIYGKGNQT